MTAVLDAPGGYDADDEDPYGEPMPTANDGAERAVLGAALIVADLIHELSDVIGPDDFWRPRHGLIFRAAVHLAAAHEPVEPQSVMARLSATGDLDRAGGGAYLAELISTVPTAANAGYYARLVAQHAVLRRLSEAGTAIRQLGQGQVVSTASMEDVAARVDKAQALLAELMPARPNATVTVGEAVNLAVEAADVASRGESAPGAVPTGLADLDRLLTGLQPGQLVVVAGRPGMGKSVLVTDFARHAAHRGQRVLMFSLEMGREELGQRVLSAEARIPLNLIRSGRLDDDAWVRAARCTADLADAPLTIDDGGGTTLAHIRATARRAARSGPLSLIVVDYLQLITGGRRSENRQQEVSELSRGLKLIAKDFGVPVVVAAQLNRQVEQRAGKLPQLSDLRESGAVEQDADVVILVHRDDYYDEHSPRSGEADLIVAKHRNGPTGTLTVVFQGHLSRFADMARMDGTP